MYLRYTSHMYIFVLYVHPDDIYTWIHGYTHDDRARWSPKGYVGLVSIIPPMNTRTTTVHGARSSCVYQAKCYIFWWGVSDRRTSKGYVGLKCRSRRYVSKHLSLYFLYISTSLLYVYKLTSLLYLHPAGMYLRYISYIYMRSICTSR
jgi:hypothetical protein